MKDGTGNLLFAVTANATQWVISSAYISTVTYPGQIISSASNSYTMSPSSSIAKPIKVSGGSNALTASFTHPSYTGTLTQASSGSTSITKTCAQIGTRAGNLSPLLPAGGGGGGECKNGKPCPLESTPGGCNAASRSLAIAGVGLVGAFIAAAAEGGVNPLADALFLAAWWAWNDAYNNWQNECMGGIYFSGGDGGEGDAFDDFLVC